MVARETAEGILDLHVPLEQAPELERAEVYVPDAVVSALNRQLLPKAILVATAHLTTARHRDGRKPVSAALNQRQTVAIGQPREKRAGLNFLSLFVALHNFTCRTNSAYRPLRDCFAQRGVPLDGVHST
jgi:hypothetical protein